jgi:hypothetical protein
MPAVKVDKVVMGCLLEAGKTTLEHLAAHRLDMSQRPGNATASRDLTRLYGELRRLRDYLQRCAGAHQENVELDLSPEDQGLLVACCRRGIDVIEQRLGGERILSADDRHWLEKKRELLADAAVELAAKPLVELPLPRLTGSSGEAGRTLLARLQTKLFGEVGLRAKIRAPTSGIHPSASGSTAGVPSFADELANVVPRDESAADADLPYLPQAGFGLPGAGGEAALVQSHQFQDPRLRALVAMDLAALTRARITKEHRIAAVLLASVLEAAVLDHAIPRRSELGLTGAPDTWNIQELLVRLMGEAFTPKDRAHVYHLFSSRNLLRPALQLVTPTVVTQVSVNRLTDFVQRALHSLGYTGASRGGVGADGDKPPAPTGSPAPEAG